MRRTPPSPPFLIRICIFSLRWLVGISKSENYLGSQLSLAKGEGSFLPSHLCTTSCINSYLVRITQNFRKGGSNMKFVGRDKGDTKIIACLLFPDHLCPTKMFCKVRSNRLLASEKPRALVQSSDPRSPWQTLWIWVFRCQVRNCLLAGSPLKIYAKKKINKVFFNEMLRFICHQKCVTLTFPYTSKDVGNFWSFSLWKAWIDIWGLEWTGFLGKRTQPHIS